MSNGPAKDLEEKLSEQRRHAGYPQFEGRRAVDYHPENFKDKTEETLRMP